MFSNKFKLHHCYFKSSPSICSNWINYVIFFIFPSKIHVSLTDVVSSISSPWYRLSSGQRHHAITPCHASFPWSQDELGTSASSFGDVSSCHLPSRFETETLNPHHSLSSPDSPTPILHWYRKVISILITLHITQPHLHFTSSLVKAPRHRSSIRHRRSLSSSSHTHHPSTQRHSRWQTI
jgi:hypothetical protein